MFSFESLNHKPYAYYKPADMVELAGGYHVEDGEKVTNPVRLRDLFFQPKETKEHPEYGDSIVAVTYDMEDEEGYPVAFNLPSAMVADTKNKILSDGPAMSMIARGQVGIIFYEYVSNRDREKPDEKRERYVGCRWVEL